MFSPLSSQKKINNKVSILYPNACSIPLYRANPVAQRHFIKQKTLQQKVRKSSETKGSQWDNFYWTHSLHP